MAPKFVPVIVTDVPITPEIGVKFVRLGDPGTVNSRPLLASPFTVTTTLPVVAWLGTGTTIDVALQLVGVAVVPLNDTALLPWVVPKFAPEIVTGVPTAPDVGERLERIGGGLAPLPTPVREIFSGTLNRVTDTARFPLLVPFAVGAKITSMVQLPPTAKGDDETQLSVSK